MIKQQTASLQSQVSNHQDDLLWRHLKTVPAFRALLRAVEARFYQQTEMPGPILDLGCGDGHFSRMTFNEPLDAGIDPWWGPLKKAQRSGMYRHLTQGLGDQMPFPDHYFGTVISNSVLEHIPNIQNVLNDTSRVLQPGGKLIITMPSHLFTEQLGGAEFFERLGAKGLADQYRRFFNFIARHVHTDTPEVWAERLAQAGFVVERWQYYFSREALHALEWGHVQGLPSAIIHALTGHWILAPWEDNLRRTEQWVRPFYEEEFQPEGTYIFFVARKEADGPIEANLPQARPFALADFETETETETEAETPKPSPQQTTKPETTRLKTTRLETTRPETTQPETTRPETTRLETTRLKTTRLIPLALLAASLFCAVTGQAILSGGAEEPAAGLRWYGYSLILLLLLAWQQKRIKWPKTPRFSIPRPGKIPRQRWYYLLALFFALFAPRLVNNPAGNPHPGLAITLWLAAIGIAFYALKPVASSRIPSTTLRTGTHHVSRFTFHASRFTLLTTAALFLLALIVRAVNLTSHPFVINGVEASIGLDVLSVRDGLLQSPFATGWLTNPTLLYFLLVWPLRLLGPSALSIRLLSPVAGAMTVALTFVIGQRLWGRMVGLVAAVLLLGSHFHLHYSRLGMTNIWDPLLVLLALGLLGAAWQSGTRMNADERGSLRFVWLAAGTAVGLNIYLFTSSHLLPLMLLVMAALALLFDREAIKRQWRHILAAGALAFIVALPQMVYYRSNPTVFMDRARNLGILDSQTGWLAQESARTGMSEGEILRDRVVQALLSFNYGVDKSGSYRPERPLLNFGMSILFVLGLFITIARLRQFQYGALLAWVIVPVIFGGALLLESPSSHRLIIAAPALALLAAITLIDVAQLAARHSPLATRPLIALLAIAAFLAILDISFYFGTYRQQHTFADRNTEIADNVADYLNNLDGETWTAYFYGPPSMYINFPTIPFLAEGFHAGDNLYDVNAPDDELAPAAAANRAFIFLPERAGEIERTRALYPNGRLQTFPGFHADPLFYVYEVEE